MDCKKAQRLFDDLSRERLAFELAAEVRQHLGDCTDCRVLEQRAARLQRVLALKRYERPSPEYFNNFLTEFHSRLLAETQPRPAWWERVLGGIDDFLSAEAMQVWRYGLASTLGVSMIVGLMWMGLRPSEFAGASDQATASLMVTPFEPPASQSAPVASSLFPSLPHIAPVDYQLAMADNADAATARTASPTPQYVLDHISVTPASYDVPDVHF